MLAIYKKELRSYFNSLVGYVFISFFLAVIGLYFFVYNINQGQPNFEYALASISFVYMILVPIITMKIMAEENKQKTDQLLLTSPVSIHSIVIGKYLAVMTVYGIVMLICCAFPLILGRYGTVNYKTAYSAILGTLFLGGAFLAIGLFVSTCTENQLVAAVVTFLIVLLATLSDGIASLLPTDNRSAWIVFSAILLILVLVSYLIMRNPLISLGAAAIGEVALTVLFLVKPAIYDGSVVKVFGWFSILARYDDFTSGILNVTSIIYYISIIFLFNFLAVQGLNKRRWS